MNNLNKHNIITVVVNDLNQRFKEIKNTTKINPNKSFNDSDGALTDKSGNLRKDPAILDVHAKSSAETLASYFNEAKELMTNAEEKLKLLKSDQQKRLISKFNEREIAGLEKNVSKFSKEIIEFIRNIESIIKKVDQEKVNTTQLIIMRNNIKVYLNGCIQEFSKKLKSNQDQYVKKYKELVGDTDTYSDSHKSGLVNNANSTGDKGLLKQSLVSEETQSRTREIDSLVSSIEDLAHIMKDFQTLVFEQGTILDRIDHNIEVALENTVEANEELKKANENFKSNCFRNSSLALIGVIFVETVLLILKYK